MIIEARMVKTLKAGDNVWVKGERLLAPLHPVILKEIRLNTGRVKVIREERPPAPVIGTTSSIVGNITSNQTHDDFGWSLPTTTTAPPPVKPKRAPKGKARKKI